VGGLLLAHTLQLCAFTTLLRRLGAFPQPPHSRASLWPLPLPCPDPAAHVRGDWLLLPQRRGQALLQVQGAAAGIQQHAQGRRQHVHQGGRRGSWGWGWARGCPSGLRALPPGRPPLLRCAALPAACAQLFRPTWGLRAGGGGRAGHAQGDTRPEHGHGSAHVGHAVRHAGDAGGRLAATRRRPGARAFCRLCAVLTDPALLHSCTALCTPALLHSCTPAEAVRRQQVWGGHLHHAAHGGRDRGRGRSSLRQLWRRWRRAGGPHGSAGGPAAARLLLLLLLHQRSSSRARERTPLELDWLAGRNWRFEEWRGMVSALQFAATQGTQGCFAAGSQAGNATCSLGAVCGYCGGVAYAGRHPLGASSLKGLAELA
jgi:hypothetical protein